MSARTSTNQMLLSVLGTRDTAPNRLLYGDTAHGERPEIGSTAPVLPVIRECACALVALSSAVSTSGPARSLEQRYIHRGSCNRSTSSTTFVTGNGVRSTFIDAAACRCMFPPQELHNVGRGTAPSVTYPAQNVSSAVRWTGTASAASSSNDDTSANALTRTLDKLEQPRHAPHRSAQYARHPPRFPQSFTCSARTRRRPSRATPAPLQHAWLIAMPSGRDRGRPRRW